MDTTNIVQENYDSLKSNVKQLQLELDNRNQQVYDCKKQLSLAVALDGDYLQEIETLQSIKNARVEKLQREIKQMEARTVGLREAFNSELAKKADLIENLQGQVREFEKAACKDLQSKHDRSSIETETNQLLKEEISMLTYKLVDIQMNIDSLQKQNLELEESNNNLQYDLDDAKQNLTCKSQALEETKNLIGNLQNEIVCAKLDLDSSKSKPLDPFQQGNSLFAEVDDSRIKMQKNIEKTKKSYVEMKRGVYTKLKKIAVLRGQNLELVRQLNMIKDQDEEYDRKVAEYETEIAILESALMEYKQKGLEQQKLTGKDLPNYTVEFANNTIRSKWNDIEIAGENLSRVSSEKLKTFKEIQSASTIMRGLRRKAQELKVKIEEKENLIIEIRLQHSPTEVGERKSQDVNNVQTTREAPKENEAILEDPIKKPPITPKLEAEASVDCIITKDIKSTSTTNQEHIPCKLDYERSDIKRKLFFNNSITTPKADRADAICMETTLGFVTPRESIHGINANTELKIENNTNENETLKPSDAENNDIDKTPTKCFEESSIENSVLYVNNAGHTPAINPHRIKNMATKKSIRFHDEKSQLLLYMNNIGHATVENMEETLLHINNSMQMSTNHRKDMESTIVSMNKMYDDSYSIHNSTSFCDQELTLNNFGYKKNAGHTPAPNRKQIIDYYTLTTPNNTLESDDIEENLPLHVNNARQTGNHQQISDDPINRRTCDLPYRRSRQQAENEGSLLTYIDDISVTYADDDDETSVTNLEEELPQNTNEELVSDAHVLKFECNKDEEDKENLPFEYTYDHLNKFSKSATEIKTNNQLQQAEQKITKLKRASVPILLQRK